jgi:hypothetical protein
MYPGKLTQTTSNTASKTRRMRCAKSGCEVWGGRGWFFSTVNIDCDEDARLLRSKRRFERKLAFRKDVGFVKKPIVAVDRGEYEGKSKGPPECSCDSVLEIGSRRS